MCTIPSLLARRGRGTPVKGIFFSNSRVHLSDSETIRASSSSEGGSRCIWSSSSSCNLRCIGGVAKTESRRTGICGARGRGWTLDQDRKGGDRENHYAWAKYFPFYFFLSIRMFLSPSFSLSYMCCSPSLPLSLFSLCVYMWMGVCLLQDILPLAIRKSVSSSTGSSRNDVSDKEASTMLEPVESCSVTFSLNPATGLVVVSEQKGKMVRDRRDEYWFGVQIICSILLLVLLLSSPFLYNFFRERSVKAEHIKWLKSFYLLHAPEVRRSCHSS